jgi:hypothetical protein
MLRVLEMEHSKRPSYRKNNISQRAPQFAPRVEAVFAAIFLPSVESEEKLY